MGHSSCGGDSGGPLVNTRAGSIRKGYYSEQVAIVGGTLKYPTGLEYYARLEDEEVLNWIQYISNSGELLRPDDDDDEDSTFRPTIPTTFPTFRPTIGVTYPTYRSSPRPIPTFNFSNSTYRGVSAHGNTTNSGYYN